MNIRRMKQEDVPEVAELEARSFSLPWSARSLSEALQRESYVFVVAEEERIIGYGGMLCIPDEADIINIAVDSAWFRRGVGTKILAALLAEAKQRKIRAVTLEVRDSNAAAIALYEKMGFVTVGIRKGFYEKPKEDARIMWKRSL